MVSQAAAPVVETVDEKHKGQNVSDVVSGADSTSDKSREPHQVKKDEDDDDGASLPSMEVLHAAGVGLDEDDPNQPCLTIRMWVIGIAFCIVGSGVNALNTMRIPSELPLIYLFFFFFFLFLLKKKKKLKLRNSLGSSD